MAKEAESIARTLGDADVLGIVLLGARHIGRHPSRLEEHLRRAVELEQLGQRSGSLALMLGGLNAQALLHLERGELSASFERSARFFRLLDDRHLPFFQITARIQRASRALLEGDLERAESLAMETVPLAKDINHPPMTWAGTTVASIRRLQGRDAESIGSLERIVSRDGDTTTIYRSVLAAAQARSGSLDDARRNLSMLRDAGYSFPVGYAWTQGMSELAEAADLTGDAQAGAHVLSECRSYSGWLVVPGTTAVRPIDQVLAQAALATGDAIDAEAHASRAVAASRRNETPAFLARELVFLAESRRRLGSPSGEVLTLVREALAVAEPLGIRVVALDIERYLLPS
jgi:hypothetical protein